jgi:hypothetical protein
MFEIGYSNMDAGDPFHLHTLCPQVVVHTLNPKVIFELPSLLHRFFVWYSAIILACFEYSMVLTETSALN